MRWSPFARAQAKPLTVGVIYVGARGDYGYNQAHARCGGRDSGSCPGIKVVEEENVPETVAVQKTMESDDRAGRRDAAVPDVVRLLRSARPRAWRRRYPDVRFSHCGGLVDGQRTRRTSASFFGYIDECQYLNGVDRGPA